MCNVLPSLIQVLIPNFHQIQAIAEFLKIILDFQNQLTSMKYLYLGRVSLKIEIFRFLFSRLQSQNIKNDRENSHLHFYNQLHNFLGLRAQIKLVTGEISPCMILKLHTSSDIKEFFFSLFDSFIILFHGFLKISFDLLLNF